MDTSIRFMDFCKSSITKGYYQVQSNVTSSILDHETCVHSSETYDIVMGEHRFVIPEEEIYSCYPPIGSCGDYSTTIPHIVFNTASLPWNYGFEYQRMRVPGLALFLCKQDEGIVESTCMIRNIMKVNGTIYVSDAMKHSDVDMEKDEDFCNVIDMPMDLFLSICPSINELTLLTHVREVKLDYKETDTFVKDGRFSCLCTNRYPYEASDEEEGHDVYVVSLTEYQNILDGSMSKQQCRIYNAIRLLYYKKWNFKTAKKSYDFLSVVKHLHCDTLHHTLQPELQEPHLRQVIKKGYIPLNHNVRDGSKTVSFYRGPLLPIQKKPSAPRYHIYADELYFCDPSTGLLDVSYACAWRLGRMLCMQNLSLCQQLLSWRMENSNIAANKKQLLALADDILMKEDTCTSETLLDSLRNACVQSMETYEEELNEKR